MQTTEAPGPPERKVTSGPVSATASFLNMLAMPSMVGRESRPAKGSLVANVPTTVAIRRIASSEWPPMAKKLSVTATLSIPSTSHQII